MDPGRTREGIPEETLKKLLKDELKKKTNVGILEKALK